VNFHNFIFVKPYAEKLKQHMKISNLPVAAKCEPTAVQVEAGKSYAWCTCGLSSKQPLCDGQHKQTWYEENGEEQKPWKSLRFTAEEDGEVWLCNCKQTKNPPFCDGSHRAVAAAQ
jgi:CDGSH-type Zn-finger protein